MGIIKSLYHRSPFCHPSRSANEFEKNVTDPGKAFNNPAGKLIDFIEEKLSVKSDFIRDVKEARKEARKTGWISLEEIEQSINV